MIIPAADIYDWLYKLSEQEFQQLTTEEKNWGGESCPGDEFDITYYLEECTPQFRAWLLEKGLGVSRPWGGEALIHVDPTKLEEINQETIKIQEELNWNPGGPGHTMPTWEKYGLKGDDDVDYNGGYIQIAIDVINAYLKREESL